MKRFLTLGTAVAILCAGTNAAMASDARSIALGSAVIANGKGVHGALSNPASMMAMQRRNERAHVRFGFSWEFRDTGESIDTLTDSENENLISDIENEIDSINNRPIGCIDPDNPSAACITGTQNLSDLSGRLLDIIDLVDNESLEGLGVADLGMAYTATKVPFAVNLRVSATGFGTPDIANDDRAYISEFSELLDGDTLSLDEIAGANFLSISDTGLLTVKQPEDILKSGGYGGAVLRAQLEVPLATTVVIAGMPIDVGVSPKFSSLTAQSLDVDVSDEFVDDVPSVADRFDDSEVTENSFTADIGGSMMLPDAPVQVAAVIRNMIPESITTRDGFKFETTPQLIFGALYQRGMISVTGDLALNEAKQDNFRTQKMGVGVEFGTRMLALRGGISHDAARKNNATSLSLGFGLGPLQVGGRLTDLDAMEIGAQLAFSF